jgi:hypothetical protein
MGNKKIGEESPKANPAANKNHEIILFMIANG